MPYYDREDYAFGFDSMKKLNRWFCKTNRKELHNHNYVIKVFDVDKQHAYSSKFQSIFKRDEATLVETIDLVY